MDFLNNIFSFYNSLISSSWNIEVLGNTAVQYMTALVVVFAFVVAFKFFQLYIVSKLQKISAKTDNDIDDALISLIKDVKPIFYNVVGLYIGLKSLSLGDAIESFIYGVLLIVVAYQAVITIQNVITYTLNKFVGKKGDKDTQTAVAGLSLIIKIALWVFGLLAVLSNLGVNVTSLVAGLGIGGIAIAFAIKEILADLFSSFVIYFDKPFGVGDTIKVGDKTGTVEKIGIKTTRLRSPDGEEVSISNQKLTSADIENLGRREERRHVFSIGVAYETPIEKLKKIPAILENIIEGVENINFDRAHLKNMGDFSLNFEVVFKTESSDFRSYMDAIEKVNLAILDTFEKEKIEIAYPTQVNYNK